jgi:hypothetical protein
MLCCYQIASAAFAALARFGTGGFAVGYKSEFVDAASEAGKYSVMTAGGRAVKETSKVGQCMAYMGCFEDDGVLVA